MKVNKDWLATKANKLVDMHDLQLIQECIKMQQDCDWFALPNDLVRTIVPVCNSSLRRRKARLVRDGVLERHYHQYNYSVFNEHVYRLAGAHE